jgi:hypothetical protein
MKNNFSGKRVGFTLIEMSIAIMLGLAISGMTLGLFQQQLAFLKIYKSQSFLTEEAPIIGMYVSKLIGKSDGFHLFQGRAEAEAGVGPNNGPASCVVLKFRQPDGTIRGAMLAFEPSPTGEIGLYYYIVPVPFAPLVQPQWAVMRPASIGGTQRGGSFSVVGGILQMTLTGENNEVITYSGSM